MKTYPSLIGERFDKLVVEEQLPSDKYGNRRWRCRCDCGGTATATTGELRSGHVTSCGCKKSPDITGMTYGKLMVIGRSDKRSSRGKRTTPLWECRCECGAIVYRAKDTLTNSDENMCAECANKEAALKMKKAAGFVDGTQISKLKSTKLPVTNTSGCKGVYFERKSKKWRARIKFKGQNLNYGSYEKFEDAVAARKRAEQEILEKFFGGGRTVVRFLEATL